MKRKYLADLEVNPAELKDNSKKSAVILSEKKKDGIMTDASFLNPARHFQKDRAIRTLIFLDYLNKELIGTLINKELSLIVTSYFLSPLHLNSILKIASNNFTGSFYPLSMNIKSDVLPTDQRELATAIIDTLRFLQIDWLKEKLFNPYDLLIAENDKLHSSDTEVLFRNKGREFLKNISTITTTKHLHEPFDQFVENFLGIIENKEIRKIELVNTLYTVMYKALQNYLIELNAIENKLTKYILQESNEDILGEQKENGKLLSFTEKESAPFFEELIVKTSNEKLRELYLKIQPSSKSTTESINEHIKEKFTDKELETLILLQCFKWPLAAKYLYRRVFSQLNINSLNSLIYSTGFIHLADLLLFPAGNMTTINLFAMIQKNNQAYLFYESHHFLQLLFFLQQNPQLGNSFKKHNAKPAFQTLGNFKDILLHFCNDPGLVDNLLYHFQHQYEVDFEVAKSINPFMPNKPFSMMIPDMIAKNWYNFPTRKLSYQLIPYLGLNLLLDNIFAMSAERTNFRGMAQGLVDKIEYYMPYLVDVSEKKRVLLHLQDKIRVSEGNREADAILLNGFKKALSICSSSLTDQEREHFSELVSQSSSNRSQSSKRFSPSARFSLFAHLSPYNTNEEKCGLLPEDKPTSNKVNFIHSSLVNAMNTCNVRSVLEILPTLYNQPGIDNIWLDLFTASFDHPLLFLLRHASEQELVRLEKACPGIWVNLPYDELEFISQQNFPVGSWGNHQAKRAFIFKGHLNYQGDTLLTYAVKKGNPDAVSFLIKKDPTLLTRCNKAGQAPVALAESFSDTTMLDLINERITASLPPQTSPMKKHKF